MKNILYIAVIVFTVNMTAAQDFNKIGNLKNTSETVVTGEMFKLIANIDVGSKDPATREMKSMIDKLTEVRIYKTGNTDSASKMKSYVDGYVKSANLSQLMYSKEDGEMFSFYIKKGSTDKKIRNLVMFIDEGNRKGAESVFMVITGDLDLDQVSKITKYMNVPGQAQIEKATKSK
jgi:hypothetical protein